MQSAAEDVLHRDVAAAILEWWPLVREERDRLPWRRTNDPWGVLVSEFMLAQTQVGRVAQRFGVFMETFPSPRICAAASKGDVIRNWVGLGYNRRAVSLWSSARLIVEQFGGEVPHTLEDLLQLPGVGPYTARAVLSFAFAEDVAVVDTNIARVLARVTGERLTSRRAQELATEFLGKARSGRVWNLSVMDFGSLVCRSRDPKCSSCPLASNGLCRWRSSPAEDADDPARGRSASEHFDGSRRQARGRLIKACCTSPVDWTDVAEVLGWQHQVQRAERVARDLVDEGLLKIENGRIFLPE